MIFLYNFNFNKLNQNIKYNQKVKQNLINIYIKYSKLKYFVYNLNIYLNINFILVLLNYKLFNYLIYYKQINNHNILLLKLFIHLNY
uniref:Uncharacterized protein n=1 Tax=Nephromyces sp. ex Molgula occidentalis TaxID=2544991 RepID=A0A5C1H7M6_9APIC|nr:hypothetical protein [Nephromyces sp. ex Molgula occidentalis]